MAIVYISSNNHETSDGCESDLMSNRRGLAIHQVGYIPNLLEEGNMLVLSITGARVSSAAA